MNAPVAWQGAKKGAKTPRQPVESPDSLRSVAYAKILDLVAEGEVKGLVAPGYEGLKGVFLDGTPIQGQDGAINFDNVTFDFRPGSQDQSYIPGFPSVENEVVVGVELRSGSPVVRNLTNADLSALRIRLSVPSLQQTDTSNGDIKGYSIQYAVDVSTDGGAYSTVLTSAMTGKTTGGYERSHRIDLPEGSNWQVRIRRLTANRDMATIADSMFVQSITEIIDAKLRYPNSALSALIIDASQFQSVPTRSFFGDWRIIRVPSNYDPELRTYTGLWDGTFKVAWSNNPAWVYFDLCTNDRFALGNLIDPARVDKWRLYQIAQYCDQPVSDGMGGQEPRFTFNAQIQTRADAYRVLQDMAATFRGISFYALGQVMAAADMPADPVYIYTAANVIDGRFTYQGTARRARHTYALVSWNDPADFGRAKVEPVEYRPGIVRHGLQPLEITAFGCTSKAQAQRVGLHALISENLETETVTFRVGLDGAIAQPYDVIQIADQNRAGRRIGGRIRAATAATVTLDRPHDALAAGQTLRMMLPTGRSEARTIESVAGPVVTVTAPWSALPRKDAVWAVESAELALQTFRVLSVTEVDDVTYELTALKHVPQKFAAIDDGVRIELPPLSVIPPSIQAPPTNVVLSSNAVIDQGIATNVLTITWDTAPKAVAYDVEWRRDDLDWVRAGRVTAASIDVRGIYAGSYVARVRAVSALGGLSIPAIGGPTEILGKTTPPPSLASLVTQPQVFGIGLKWTFPAGAADTERTEIWYGPSPLLVNAMKLGDFAYPQNTHQMLGLAAGVSFFFWGRLVDKSGNVGPFYPVAAGVNGQSSSDAGPILDYLAGQIGRTELSQELLTPIDAVPALEGAVADLEGEIEAINAQIADVVGAPEFASNAAYAQGALVRYQGALYRAKQAMSPPAPAPTNTTYWEKIGDYASLGEAVAALSVDVTDLETRMGETEGDVSALASQASTLATQVNGNTAAIQSESSARSTADSALSTRIDGVYAQVNAPMAGDNASRAGSTTIMAGVWSEASARADADQALGVRIDVTVASVGANTAAIQSEATARATADSALGTRIDTTVASVGENAAAIQTEATARANADGALGQQISTVQATANGAQASAQQALTAASTLDGRLNAFYTIRAQVDANGKIYAAGMALGVEQTASGMQTQILFQADRLALVNTANGAISTPFIIESGQTFINQAFIKDGSIENAKIGNVIQSTATGAGGQPRWKLDKNGTITLTGPSGSGYLTITDSLLQVFNASGMLLVRLGDW